MKVIHLNPSLKPGGVNEQAADLARGLQAMGLHNMVMAPASDLIGTLNAADVRHTSCRAGTWFRRYATAKRLRAILRSQKPEVLQVYTPEAAMIAYLACRKIKPSRRPTIVSVITGFLSGRWQTWAMMRADAIVFVSKFLRKEMAERRLLPHGKPVWVIPYGVDEKLCHPGYAPSANWMEQWRLTHPKADNSYSFCVPCPISPLHGLEDLAPILTTLMHNGVSPRAYLVGDSRKADPIYLESLRQHFAEAQVDERIVWLGCRPDLRDVVCACDVTLYLARRPETYNRPILEALSLGRPVVAYDHGVTCEMLDSFLPEGRVAPGDYKEVADILLQWRTYRPSLPGEVPYPFRLKDMVETYCQLYKELRKHRIERETAASVSQTDHKAPAQSPAPTH